MLIAMDHDQRFKTLIREFFADFLRLFFAAWAARLDLSGVEWLDKEVFTDPPGGDVYILDLVARLRSRTLRSPQRQVTSIATVTPTSYLSLMMRPAPRSPSALDRAPASGHGSASAT